MPRSFDKGEWLGKLPACAICMGRGHGPRALLHLPLGVSVWLCAAHRDPEWLASRAGRDLVVSLQTVWGAANCLTARRSRALSLFQAALRSAHRARRLPGSYSWRELRREAEGRFAAGEPPSAVIDELRRRELNRPGPAHPPSVQTMRRWFRDGRWRGRTRPGVRRAPAARPRRGDATPGAGTPSPWRPAPAGSASAAPPGGGTARRRPRSCRRPRPRCRPASRGPTGRPSNVSASAAQDLAVQLLQAERVHLQQLERLLRHRPVDARCAPDLGDVAHPPQQAVGDARRPPRPLGQRRRRRRRRWSTSSRPADRRTIAASSSAP